MSPPVGKYNFEKSPNRPTFIKELIKLLFPSTLEHCKRMLDDSLTNNVELYLLTQPRRLYNIAIVDDSKKLLQEMYMMRSDGIAIPDEVSVHHDETSEEIKAHIKGHHGDLSKIIQEQYRNYCIKLTSEDFE